MAINVMSWVWEHSRSRGFSRLVLLAIADCASSDGGEAWPSIKELARKGGISVSAVHAAVKNLAQLGELEITYNGGKAGVNGRTNRYRVIMVDYGAAAVVTDCSETGPDTHTESVPLRETNGYGRRTPAESAPVRQAREGGTGAVPGGVREPYPGGTGAVPGTVLEPSDEPSVNLPAADAAQISPSGDPYPETVQGLIAEWIDLTPADKRPPEQLIKHTGAVLRGLASEGIPFADLRAGMGAWRKGGLHPRALPSVVHQLRTGGTGWQAVSDASRPARRSVGDRRAADAARIKARLRQQAGAQGQGAIA